MKLGQNTCASRSLASQKGATNITSLRNEWSSLVERCSSITFDTAFQKSKKISGRLVAALTLYCDRGGCRGTGDDLGSTTFTRSCH